MDHKRLSLAEACDLISKSSLLAYPTETFFAIGGDALNLGVVRTLYTLKKRISSRPLPVVAGNITQVRDITTSISKHAYMLMEIFWPGPLSILLPSASKVPSLLTGGTDKIAIRIPGHTELRELCLSCGNAIISSSANISGQPPAVSATDISPELMKGIAGVYDPEGSIRPAGLTPSTIVEPIDDRYGLMVRVLREGAISVNDLENVGFKCQPW